MSSYRLYLLDPHERIASISEHEFASDDDARAAAAAALQEDHYAAEVWEGDRLVDRLGGEFSLG